MQQLRKPRLFVATPGKGSSVMPHFTSHPHELMMWFLVCSATRKSACGEGWQHQSSWASEALLAWVIQKGWNVRCWPRIEEDSGTPPNKLESDIISFLIIKQPSWISSLTLFNQQRNGNGQRSPKLTRRIRSADSKDNSHLELHMQRQGQSEWFWDAGGMNGRIRDCSPLLLPVSTSEESSVHSANPLWTPLMGYVLFQALRIQQCTDPGHYSPLCSELWPRLPFALFFSGWSSDLRPTFVFCSGVLNCFPATSHFLECTDPFPRIHVVPCLRYRKLADSDPNPSHALILTNLKNVSDTSHNNPCGCHSESRHGTPGFSWSRQSLGHVRSILSQEGKKFISAISLTIGRWKPQSLLPNHQSLPGTLGP